MNEPGSTEPALTLRPVRFFFFMVSAPLVFLPGALVLGLITLRHITTEGPQPASEGFFWLCLVAVPALLLIATWLQPRRLSADLRSVQVETPGQLVPMAVYDDIRLAVVWACLGLIVLVAIGGAAASVLALTDCNVRTDTCGTTVSHRFAIYGLVLAVNALVGLAATRLVNGIRVIGEERRDPAPETVDRASDPPAAL